MNTQGTSTLQADVQNLSLRLLIVAREAVRTNPAMAGMVFGLTSRTCELLASAELQQLDELSRMGVVAFRPSFRDADLMAARAGA
jgi:hypothetical protein